MSIFDKILRFSAQRVSVGCFIYFKFKPVFFLWMYLRSIKETNRLVSKRILNTYLNS